MSSPQPDSSEGEPVDRPFVDAPVGDQHAAVRAAESAADEFGLSRPELIRVGMNALYRCGDVVLRVGRPSADPAAGIELSHRLRALDIPTVAPAAEAAVGLGDLAVTAWDFVPVDDAPIDWHAVGQIVRRVHSIRESDLPVSYPVPSPASFPWWDFARMLDAVGDRIDRAALDGLEASITRHRGWAEFDDVVVCHGDVHPGNVMMTSDGPLLIDWDLMCLAPPGWDHAMLLTLADRWGGDLAAYARFAEGYGRSLADDETTRSIAELRNVAATLMRVTAGLSDPTAAEEAEQRLRFWRGDPDAPTWSAQ